MEVIGYGKETSDCRRAGAADGIYDSCVSFDTGHDGAGSRNDTDRPLWRKG